jgi:hypothetical protein
MSAKGSGKRNGGKKGVSGNGSRCAIFEDIDSLTDCAALPENKRFPTLVAQLQKILNQLAYYAINSDGAVLEDQERWHTTFADRLYEAAGQAQTEAAAQRAAAAVAPPERASSSAAAIAVDRAPPAPVPARRPADDLPDSLRRIMNGSHSSLAESDDEN